MKIYILISIFLFLSFPISATPYIPKENDKKLVIGVNMPLGKDKALKKWTALENYLSNNISGYYFQLQPASSEDLFQSKDHLDYLLSHPQLFVEFEYNYRFKSLVTLRNIRLGQALDSFGITLFTRKDSEITSMQDLKGKKLGGIASKRAWGGWVLGWHTLVKHGIDPYRDMKIEKFSNQGEIVFAVLNGIVDVGIARTDILETMNEAGKINIFDLKLVYKNTEYGDKFPFLLSSKLYPEWVFSANTQTNPVINRHIASLLLALDKTSSVSKAANIDGWTTSANYQEVAKVLQDLKLPPYEDYGKITINNIIKKYWFQFIISCLVFSTLIFLVLYFRRLNKLLNEKNKDLLMVQTKLAQSEQIATIGNIITEITYEINAPLTSAKSNITLIKEEYNEHYKDKSMNEMIDYVIDGLDNVSALIVNLTNYGNLNRPKIAIVNLHDGLNSTLFVINDSIKQIAKVHKKYHSTLKAECCLSQLNQVFMNILMNAIDAIQEKTKELTDIEEYFGQITLETWDTKDAIFIKITDNGNGIKKSLQKNIFEAMFTTKETGIGMGLTLSKQIIENHYGVLSFESIEKKGTQFTIKLPIQQPKRKNK